MIFTKVISFLIILLGLYYITIVLHILGLLKITDKELSLGKAFLPYWYWFGIFNKKENTDNDNEDNAENNSEE